MAEALRETQWFQRPGWWGLLVVTGLLFLLLFGAEGGKYRFWEEKELPVVEGPEDSNAFLREQEILDRLTILDQRVMALDECCCRDKSKPAKKPVTTRPKQKVVKRVTVAPPPAPAPATSPKLLIPLAKLPEVKGCTKVEGGCAPKR